MRGIARPLLPPPLSLLSTGQHRTKLPAHRPATCRPCDKVISSKNDQQSQMLPQGRSKSGGQTSLLEGKKVGKTSTYPHRASRMVQGRIFWTSNSVHTTQAIEQHLYELACFKGQLGEDFLRSSIFWSFSLLSKVGA